jgi:threonine dehydrogenase-like Zn-dependent dehydrogenase
MRATLMYGAGDVRVEHVPGPVLREPADALVRVLRSCICGSDPWPYWSMPASEHGRRMGHEFLGVVEDTGAEVSGLRAGDVVVAPHAVLECVGTSGAIDMALGVARDGGVVSRVGAAQYTEVPMDFGTFFRNITLTGGVAPARAYIDELMPDILDGSIGPGRAGYSTRRPAWTTCRTGTGPWPSAGP